VNITLNPCCFTYVRNSSRSSSATVIIGLIGSDIGNYTVSFSVTSNHATMISIDCIPVAFAFATATRVRAPFVGYRGLPYCPVPKIAPSNIFRP